LNAMNYRLQSRKKKEGVFQPSIFEPIARIRFRILISLPNIY
jgi:hypothetical protein